MRTATRKRVLTHFAGYVCGETACGKPYAKVKVAGSVGVWDRINVGYHCPVCAPAVEQARALAKQEKTP